MTHDADDTDDTNNINELDDIDVDFSAFGLDSRLIQALTTLGYEEPTPIQAEAIPHLIAGRDLIGQAATGTGKTAAFALPLLHRLATRKGPRAQPFALILVPTRELAMQVAEAVHRYGRAMGATVLPIYGGQSFIQQLKSLQRGVDVIVATPGRALDHMRQETLKLDTLSVVILDEADEMFDMGFAEDIESILDQTPASRQTVLFSATLPPRVGKVAQRHLKDPIRIQVQRQPLPQGETPLIRQTAYLIQRAYKLSALGRILDLENPTSALVFCRTRNEVDELTETLNARGYRAEALHGGMSQDQRTRVIKHLKGGISDLVIATDVAARGLDIDHLSHVVNYNVPSSPDAYIHRIGRVGRAGREGVAITLVEPREHRMLRNYEQATKRKIEIAQVPTIADLRAHRLEITRTTIREVLLAGELDTMRVVVQSLSDEFDLMDVALAAVKVAHQASAPDATDATDIPPVRPPRDEFDPRSFSRGEAPRPSSKGEDPRPSSKGGKAPKAAAPTHESPARGPRGGHRGPTTGMTRIQINVGRNAGIRPQDIVGAIAGEAGITGRDVGAIDITERFSLVEVPESVAADVLNALRSAKIRGKKIKVRRDNRFD